MIGWLKKGFKKVADTVTGWQMPKEDKILRLLHNTQWRFWRDIIPADAASRRPEYQALTNLVDSGFVEIRYVGDERVGMRKQYRLTRLGVLRITHPDDNPPPQAA